MTTVLFFHKCATPRSLRIYIFQNLLIDIDIFQNHLINIDIDIDIFWIALSISISISIFFRIALSISISIFFKSVDISTINISYWYIEQGYLRLILTHIVVSKDSYWLILWCQKSISEWFENPVNLGLKKELGLTPPRPVRTMSPFFTVFFKWELP